MRIEPEHSVAVAVDFQERLMPVMDQKEKLIANASILLAGLRLLEVPIYTTQQYTRGLGMTIPEITEAIGSDAYIEKIKFSAFDDVEQLIREKKFVIICGIEAHICVIQTVIDLKEKGFVPVLVVDCISSREPTNKEYAIMRAKEEGAILTTCESLLFELLREAGTSVSKKIQRLIK